MVDFGDEYFGSSKGRKGKENGRESKIEKMKTEGKKKKEQDFSYKICKDTYDS